VRISDRERTGNRRRITVVETGIGIPTQRRDKVFEPFSRLSAQTGVEGDVIGLQIAKQLVELMGGDIGYESDPDVGGTFWIDLPSHRPPRRS
jgi:signal transduction histidine kinase